MTTNSLSHDQCPPPCRAPGPYEPTWRSPEQSDDARSGEHRDRRHQRAYDGWMAGRIRKASRHWRSR